MSRPPRDEKPQKDGWLRPFLRRLAANSAEPEILFEGDSALHHVTVVERDGRRTLFLGPNAREAETSVSLTDPEAAVFEYPGMMLLSLAVGPKNRRILMLGLGGGFIPGLFQKRLPEHALTVVEVDPLVAELAENFFGFAPGGNVELVIADGLEHIAALPDESYDQIWLDAFDGAYIPPHLATTAFLELARTKLVEGGLLTQNLHQTAWRLYSDQLTDAKAVFGHEPLIFNGTRCGNSVAMSLNSVDDELPRTGAELAEAVKAFKTEVGPYNLLVEARKLAKKNELQF
ncbi:MAG: fused MFS/spermidine synthase [Deltaproteobacteria bacterium]|jgi:spermidine synthase|nr:fused MFS/spermidine synthase [Deltaproteobacteria bacterium]